MINEIEEHAVVFENMIFPISMQEHLKFQSRHGSPDQKIHTLSTGKSYLPSSISFRDLMEMDHTIVASVDDDGDITYYKIEIAHMNGCKNHFFPD